VLLVNEEGVTHEGSTSHPSTANYDHMCNLFGESLLMALEAQASHIANSTTTRKLGKESSEIPSGPPVASTPVGREVNLREHYLIGGFNRTARRVPITKPLGRVFFPVYRKASPVAINVLECGIRRDKSLDINTSVVKKGKLTRTKQHSVLKNASLPLSSLTL